LKEIAKKTEYFSGADLQSLLYNAQLEAIHKSLSKDDALGDPSEKVVENKPTVFQLNATHSPPFENPDTSEILSRINVINLKEDVKEKKNLNESEEKKDSVVTITVNEIENALETSRPSVSRDDRLNYERIYGDFLKSRGDFETSKSQGQKQTLA